jgi:hypothetical protein
MAQVLDVGDHVVAVFRGTSEAVEVAPKIDAHDGGPALGELG